MKRHYFPFHKQRLVEYISPERLEAFSMEQFRFAEESERYTAAGDLHAMREASRKLIESAVGEPLVRVSKWANSGAEIW